MYHFHFHFISRLLVLDEIDQLESKNQEILYKLFEMPFIPKSRLVLVGMYFIYCSDCEWCYNNKSFQF